MESGGGETSSGTGSDEYTTGVRLVVLNLPEDEGEGLGFRLTRTLWDPYPWVREVVSGARADIAGLKTGDCLLQADGKDLLGLPVGQVAGLIRGDGAGRGVSLLVWNCGVDPKDDPELLWSCGGGARGERARRALSGVLRALRCAVCAATATRARSCARSHLYCEACWARLERCALCREQLPPKESPYARNLVAEEVFEAIAKEYEIKDTVKRPLETSSARASPSRSPNLSPTANRKGTYQISTMNRYKKTVQFNDKFGQNYASDPNIHRSLNSQEFPRQLPTVRPNPTIVVQSSDGNTERNCQNFKNDKTVQTNDCMPQSTLCCMPQIKVEDADTSKGCCQHLAQHKLVTRLRQACSLADLQNAVQNNQGHMSKSLNNVNLEQSNSKCQHSHSLDNLKVNCASNSDSPPVFVLAPPPIYLVTCDHNKQ